MVQTNLTRCAPSPKLKAPPLNIIKCNVDAAFLDGSATSGVILKNHNGSIILATTFHHKCLDAVTSESLALLDACKIIEQLCLKDAIIETDCLRVIAFIHGVDVDCDWTARPIIAQIKNFWSCWPQWSFCFANRSVNGAPYALANWGFN
ncbi:hypothetical protein CASFOL_023204 [Castilleja foliolosa]|uniref:RNase H type-1 domain-containing protein n=1 Tax=Castilleja foliolosa TaxID=1961234 RepID=A0ABD3CN98_9LAMI